MQESNVMPAHVFSLPTKRQDNSPSPIIVPITKRNPLYTPWTFLPLHAYLFLGHFD